jgi:hypothetical protein
MMSKKITQYKTFDFNKNYKDEISKSLMSEQGDMMVWETKEMDYIGFYELFNIYLKKMPSNNVTKYTKTILDRKGVFVGAHLTKPKLSVFSRALITNDLKLAGIVLDNASFDIQEDGSTDNIDDCIYATYYTLIRSIIICNRTKIYSDFDFHKTVISYIYFTILKSLGNISIFTKEQLHGIYLACAYLYLRQHLELNHLAAMSRLSRLFKTELPSDVLKDWLSKFDVLSNYKLLKDIGKVLVDLDIAASNANKILINILQIFGKDFFYNLMGPLSFLIGLIVLNNYPTDLFSKSTTINTKIQNKIESYCVPYLNSLNFSIDKMKLTLGL